MAWFLQMLGLAQRQDIPVGAPPLGALAGPAPAAPADQPQPTHWVVMDSIINALSGLGSKGDKGSAGRPNTNIQALTDIELESLYQHNTYARRIVDEPAADAVAHGWYVQDPTADVDPMADEDRRLQLVTKVYKAKVYARHYGLGGILMDAEDGRKLSEPLDLNAVRSIRRLHVFSGREMNAALWDTDADSDNFGNVAQWQLSPLSGGGGRFSGVMVHWSRMLIFEGDPLPPAIRVSNNGRGSSVLQSAWDAVRNLTTVDQAAATHSQELSLPVIKVGGLRAKSSSDQQTAFNLKMMAMGKARSLLNMILLGEGDEYEQRQLALSGFDGLAARSKEALCAVTGMPQVRLFGEAPGGLNTDGESQRGLYNGRIANDQKFNLEPQLTQFYRVAYRQKTGPTMGLEPGRWEVKFHPLEQLTATGEATNRKAIAEVDAVYLEKGVLTAEQVAASRFGPRGWSAETVPVRAVQPVQSASAAARQDSADGGIPLRLELLAGEIRSGIGPDGKAWAVRMPCAYGEIPGTVGADGEPVDALLLGGDGQLAYVIEHAPGGEYDEDKVILGALDEDEATQLYRQVYGATAPENPTIYRVARTGLLDWLDARIQELERRDLADIAEEDRAVFDTERRDIAGINFSPPAAVREELQRALRWHDAGLSGDGLKPETVAWARRLAAGKPISPAKALKAWAWFQRHASDQSAEGFRRGEPGYPSPGRVAHGLWMGDPGLAWVSKLKRQLKRTS